MFTLKGFSYSLIGSREMNQDSLLVDHPRNLFAVADGVGGGMGGEIASKMAVEGLQREFTSPYELKRTFGMLQVAVLKEALSTYGEAIMGTTLTAVAVQDNYAHVCHVGDSRLYLFTNSHLRQITEDQEFYDENLQGTVLASYLGIPTESHPLRILEDKIEINKGERILLCTDGLYRQITETRIASLIRDMGSMPEGLVRTLCEEAAQASHSDNVTLVYIEIE